MTPHRLRASLAVLLASVLLVGCGSSSDKAGSDSDGASSDKAGSAGVEQSAADGNWDGEELTKDNFGERVAAAQEKAGSYTMVMTQKAAGQSAKTTVQGRVVDGATEVHTKTEGADGVVEMIQTDGTIFLKIPALKTEKPWLKVDPDAKSGIGALYADFGGNSDPKKQLKVFSEALSIKPVGDVEEIDGVDTRQYAVSLPGEAVGKQLGTGDQMTAMLPKTIEYKVWVDENDLMRKLVMDMEIMGQKSSSEILMTGYGDKVRIEMPPADQVTTKEPAMPGPPGASN